MLSSTLLLLSVAFEVSARSVNKHGQVIGPDTASNASYDFIIVGGGIAGLTVADRLTEDPAITVLVIEWGPLDNNTNGVLVTGLWNPVPYFWPNIFSIPQPGLDDQVEFVPMGQVVGGGSAINAMFYHRGGKQDYDDWEKLGNPGWGWDGLLPYFKKSENFTRPSPEFSRKHNITWDDSVHGFDGPIHTSYPPYDFAPSKNFWNAALSLGISELKDSDAGKVIGLYTFFKALDPTTETRSYAAIGHYDRVSATRPNYHLLPLHAAAKILFKNKTAIGVNYTSPSTGASSIAYAKKEVTVAAGGIHSPQILLVSGLGPKAVIESLGLKLIVDLPGVGTNMQDHLVLNIDHNFTSNIQPNAGELGSNATYEAEQSALYFSSKKGAYTITRGTGTNTVTLPLKNTTSSYDKIISFARSEDPASILPTTTDRTVLAGYISQRNLILAQYESLNSPIGEISWNTGPKTIIFMLKPLSRGSVTISSPNILDNPVIDYGALTDSNDLELVLTLFKKNREIMAQPEMLVLGPTELAPTGHITDDDELRAALRASIVPTNAHMCCTNPMMKLELGGVVDSKLRVYGVKGLSVVDISTFPIIAVGAPQASVYGTAEKINPAPPSMDETPRAGQVKGIVWRLPATSPSHNQTTNRETNQHFASSQAALVTGAPETGDDVVKSFVDRAKTRARSTAKFNPQFDFDASIFPNLVHQPSNERYIPDRGSRPFEKRKLPNNFRKTLNKPEDDGIYKRAHHANGYTVVEKALLESHNELRIKDSVLADKEKALGEQNSLVQKHEAAIIKKDGQLAARDKLLAENTTLLQEKVALAVEKSYQLGENEKLLAEKSNQLQDKVAELAGKDAWLIAKDAQLKAKDLVLVENDKSLTATTTQLQNRVAELARKDAWIKAKDTEITSKDSLLAANDKTLSQKSTQIRNNVAEMAKMCSLITAKDNQVRAQESMIVGYGKSLVEKATQLENHRKRITAMNAWITSQDSKLHNQSVELKGKNEQLWTKTEQLETQQAELRGKNSLIAAKDARLRDLESKMEETERSQVESEEKLRILTQIISDKDAQLAPNIEMLSTQAGFLADKARTFDSSAQDLGVKDKLIAIQAGQLGEKNRLLAWSTQQLTAKDMTITSQTANLDEKSKLIAYQVEKLAANDTSIASQLASLEEKDQFITSHTAALAEKDSLLAFEIQKSSEIFAAKDQTIIAKTEEVSKMQKSLAAYKALVTSTSAAAEKRNKHIESLKKQVREASVSPPEPEAASRTITPEVGAPLGLLQQISIRLRTAEEQTREAKEALKVKDSELSAVQKQLRLEQIRVKLSTMLPIPVQSASTKVQNTRQAAAKPACLQVPSSNSLKTHVREAMVEVETLSWQTQFFAAKHDFENKEYQYENRKLQDQYRSAANELRSMKKKYKALLALQVPRAHSQKSLGIVSYTALLILVALLILLAWWLTRLSLLNLIDFSQLGKLARA
ncbi:Dehydrogenase xptC [Lachnellula suecica]|uniref:Dehydrogenase xptC n=1 Tax=Lachnellula suecica TaxID=602035 RepID=A0A8T9C8M4_9HELO|nr:Dehydrogenase xptC [Lachnellula suecica]